MRPTCFIYQQPAINENSVLLYKLQSIRYNTPVTILGTLLTNVTLFINYRMYNMDMTYEINKGNEKLCVV